MKSLYKHRVYNLTFIRLKKYTLYIQIKIIFYICIVNIDLFIDDIKSPPDRHA